MTIDSTLLIIAPEFETVDPARRQSVIDLAALSVGSVFGDKRDLATAYLAAHMLTTSSRGGIAGGVKSMKEGDLSLTYGDGQSATAFGATSYGQEFERIQKSVTFTARTRMM